MKNILLITLALTLGLTSCKKDEQDKSNVSTDSKFAAELRSSATKIAIGNNNLILTTYLWRDFMPVAQKDGSVLSCVSKLTDIYNTPISGTIILKKQYVINGDEIWTSDYNKIVHDIDYILEGTVTSGPKWGPDIEVQVVCEFENSGVVYRVLANSQWINRTD